MIGRRFRLPYEQFQLFSLLALALVPLLVFGLVGAGRLDFLVQTNADQQTRDTLNAVSAVVEQRQQQLSDSVRSYATWDSFHSHAASRDSAWIENDVLDFVVSQGVADVAVFEAGGESMTSGPAAATTIVEGQIARLWRGQSRVVAITGPDGVYEMAMWPVDTGGGSGTAPVLVFAKRLDEHFVSVARSMTGWDVAVAGPDGRVRVATSLDPFSRVAAAGGPSTSATSWTRQAGGVAAGSSPIAGPDGTPVGALLVAAGLGGLANLPSQVLALLAAILAPTVLGALFLSLYLTLRIRRRLAVIEEGIGAVASGDLSVRLPTEDRDAFERLASSHNRLAAALNRRDRTLAALLDAVASLQPDAGPASVAQDGVAVARATFGFGWCELRRSDGSVVASARGPDAAPGNGVPGDPEAGPRPDGEIEVGVDDEIWRLAWGGVPPGWSHADAGLVELFAGQLGSALRDAELYERAASRARNLGRSYRLQSDFLRGVSHNLQSPLTAIVGISDELRASSALDAASRRRADVVHGEAERLRRLVRQLLTMSRLEAGTLALESELCAVDPIIERAWQVQRSDRQFELVDEAENALAVADPEALEQVFWILFDNAVRYAPSGPVRVHVALVQTRVAAAVGATRPGGASRSEHELLVRIEDEGPGVPPEERKKIFRRFRRGSTSTGIDGTGLGLDVARGLLRAMDGRISYEPGRVGATFVVAIPAEVATAPA